MTKKKDKNDSVNSSGSSNHSNVRSKGIRGSGKTKGVCLKFGGRGSSAKEGSSRSSQQADSSEHRPITDTGSGKTGLKPKQLRWTFERAVKTSDSWAKFRQGEHWLLANRAVSGEERLWWSVLSQALHDYLKPNGVKAVKWWLLSEREDEGSFIWICDHLRINSVSLRKKVMAIKEPINFNVGLSTTWGLFNSDRTPLPKKFRGGRGKKERGER
jgi:hypothetical protein